MIMERPLQLKGRNLKLISKEQLQKDPSKMMKTIKIYQKSILSEKMVMPKSIAIHYQSLKNLEKLKIKENNLKK